MIVNESVVIFSSTLAVIVSVGTFIFNVYDKKRYYNLEREKLQLERAKISREIANALLSSAKSFEKRIELYNCIMRIISEISNMFNEFAREIDISPKPSWDQQTLERNLGEIQSLLQSNQSFTTRYIHENITRGYVLQIIKLSDEIAEILIPSKGSNNRREAAKNIATHVVGLGDKAKSDIRDDLEQLVRGLAHIPNEEIKGLGAQ